MKPDDAVDDSVFLPESTLGNRNEAASDELVNGEYGLVINGHSLVRDKTILLYIRPVICMQSPTLMALLD